MKSKRPLLALVLLGAAAVFVLLAFSSPARSYEIGSMPADIRNGFKPFSLPWLYLSYGEIAEGLAVVVALTLVWVSRPRVPSFLSRPVAIVRLRDARLCQ